MTISFIRIDDYVLNAGAILSAQIAYDDKFVPVGTEPTEIGVRLHLLTGEDVHIGGLTLDDLWRALESVSLADRLVTDG